MVAFLKDPSGPPLWEENPEAKDVIHTETEKVSSVTNCLSSELPSIYFSILIICFLTKTASLRLPFFLNINIKEKHFIDCKISTNLTVQDELSPFFRSLKTPDLTEKRLFPY